MKAMLAAVALALAASPVFAADPTMAAMDILLNKGDPWHDYVALRATLPTLPADAAHPALDPFAQVDTLFGRYDDATRDFLAYAPGAAKRMTCPAAPWQRVGLDALPRAIGDARVVMINEAHSEPGTRATVIALLPALKAMGFRHMALEALVTGKEDALSKRGYAHDDTEAAVYLREPVFAELIRQASAQGFDYVAYDQIGTPNVDRDEASAGVIKAWLDAHPRERLFIVVGYGHIRRTDGWLAKDLSRIPGLTMFTIDQVFGGRGCEGEKSVAAAPSVWMQGDKAWSSRPDLVDVTLTWSRDDRRGAKATWMTLGGLRKEVRLPASTCAGKRPCLVEALVPGEDHGVPADRLGVFGKTEPAILYLKPGSYQLRVTTSAGVSTAPITVPL